MQNKKRWVYAGAFLVLLFIEVLIALYVHDDIIRPYIGDVLVVAVIYCFVRIWILKGVRFLPLWIFLFAAGVEILQYFQIVKILGLEEISFFRVLIGSVFDLQDIVCYAIGCILLTVMQFVIKKIK